MVRTTKPQERTHRAIDRGYRFGARHYEDSKPDPVKYVAKTLIEQDRMLRYYKEWLIHAKKEKEKEGEMLLLYDDRANDGVHTTGPQSLRSGLLPLDIATTKDFIRYLITSSEGVLDKQGRVTVNSTVAFAEYFFAGFTRVTSSIVSKEDRSAIYRWVRCTLRPEGIVVNKAREKHLFGKEELVAFTITFWSVDDAHFVHPRNKVQIPFLISVFCWTGARIGAFFPNNQDKKEGGLRYRDIDLVLRRCDGDNWKAIYSLSQRWVKNNRDPEDIVYRASTSQHEKLLYDDTQYLITMAITDKALYGINSYDAFLQLRIPPGEDHLIIPWNPESLHLPILRNATMTQGVTEDPLKQSTFENIFRWVMQLSGYFGSATVHAIRRGLGKKIDERYTEVQRSQHLIQSDPRVFGTDYVANSSSVCGKRAFVGENADHSHVDYFQSFAPLREKGLPRKLPAEKSAEIRWNPELLQLQDHIRVLKINKASGDNIAKATAELTNRRNRLTNQALQQYKEDWVQERRRWKILTQGKKSPNDIVKVDLSLVLSRLMPEYGRLASRMMSESEVSTEQREQTMRDLCVLASRDCAVVYLPGEEPINGRCPVEGCELLMTNLPKDQRSTHVHGCQRKEMARTKKRNEAELRYCFDCFDWHVEEYWDKHCQMHIDHIRSRRCASIVYCNTLLRPSFCPFCIGNPQLLAGKRWESWTRDTKLRTHLNDHLDQSRWPLKCPHPLCEAEEGFSNRLLFLYHLDNAHDLDTRQMQDDCRHLHAKVVKPMRVIAWTPDITGQKRKKLDGFDDAFWPATQHENLRKVAKIIEKSAFPSMTTVSPASLQLPVSEHPEQLVVVDTQLTTTTIESAEALTAEWGFPKESFRYLNYTQAQGVNLKALSPKLQPLIDLDDEASLQQPLELSATILSPKLALPDLLPSVGETIELDSALEAPAPAKEDCVETLGEDIPFSDFLRSPSPTYVPGFGENSESTANLQSQATESFSISQSPAKPSPMVGSSMRFSSNMTERATTNVIQDRTVTTIRHVKLKLRGPKPPPKYPALRLSRPKQKARQRPVRPSIKRAR